jgi:hypothetical protein
MDFEDPPMGLVCLLSDLEDLLMGINVAPSGSRAGVRAIIVRTAAPPSRLHWCRIPWTSMWLHLDRAQEYAPSL